MLYAKITASEYSLLFEVGYLEAEEPQRRLFQFGLSTEVHVSQAGFGQDGFAVNVIRSSVNAGAGYARTALNTFAKAIEIAEFINRRLEDGENDLLMIGSRLTFPDVQKEMNYRIIQNHSRIGPSTV